MKNVRKQKLIAAGTLSAMLFAQTSGPMDMGVAIGASPTKTPIQNAIVIIGENRTFDHLFGTYIPPKGQTVENLLSEGIVLSNGQPGPHAYLADQYEASDTTTYSISPTLTDPYTTVSTAFQVSQCIP
jgi:phospholipase C